MAEETTYNPEPRFVGEIVTLVDNVGQGFGWWEGQNGDGPPQVIVQTPPPKDYTGVIIGVAAGLFGLTVIMYLLLKP